MDWNRAGVFSRLLGKSRELPLTLDGRNLLAQAQYRQAMRESQQASLWDTPLEEIRYVVVDTETTGFNSVSDHLISIAAVEVQGERMTGRCMDTRVSLPPDVTIPQVVADLTGITMTDLHGAPGPIEAVRQFIDFLDQDVLIAHFAKHDLLFINKYLRQAGFSDIENRVLDTANLYSSLHKSSPRHPALEELLIRYQVTIESRHTALGDASMTARAWQKLMLDLRQHEIRTLGDTLELLVTK
ncbi:MAG: polymerase subunit epsilon [Bacilli bacterium]|nr:polymerase subunit epsilon [Bacilli bacterium]